MTAGGGGKVVKVVGGMVDPVMGLALGEMRKGNECTHGTSSMGVRVEKPGAGRWGGQGAWMGRHSEGAQP